MPRKKPRHLSYKRGIILKLSAVLLSEMINKEFHVVSQGNLETTESFLRPFLFEDGSGFSTGHICVVVLKIVCLFSNR